MCHAFPFHNFCILWYTIVIIKEWVATFRTIYANARRRQTCVVSFVMRAHELTISIFETISNSSQILTLIVKAKRNPLFATQFFLLRLVVYLAGRYVKERRILNYIPLFNCTVLLLTEQIWTNSMSTIFQYHSFSYSKI